jgi:transposase
MKPLTRTQTLEKQNKELRVRLENREGKAELALAAMEEERARLKAACREKDRLVAMLQKEIGALTQALKDAGDVRAQRVQEQIDAAVAAATAPLLDELEKAHLEIARLKAVINRDSSNSSKPPSMNGFKEVVNSRVKSGRQKGGQQGHPGHRLALPGNLDELVAKGIVRKQVVDHTGGQGEYISRYVIDMEVVTIITEHRYAPDAELPRGLYNEVGYGDNVRAMGILLLSEGIIGELRLAEMLEGLTHGVVSISPATLERYKKQFAQALEESGELEAIKEDLLNGEVMHVDDTPLRCAQTVDYAGDGGQARVADAEGGSFRATVRTHSNARSTFYTANPKKDIEGIERDGILPRFFGILGHDHEIKFYRYGKWHATCGEHLLRDLVALRDLGRVPWAEGMRLHMAGMNKQKNRDVEAGRVACDPTLLAGYVQTYDDLIRQGWAALRQMRENELGLNDFRAMLNRLVDYKDCYLLFMRNYKAPFTNNLAERDLRLEKTKEKVSGLFRSWQGLLAHTNVRSFISTVKKRKGDIFKAITDVNTGIPVLR